MERLRKGTKPPGQRTKDWARGHGAVSRAGGSAKWRGRSKGQQNRLIGELAW